MWRFRREEERRKFINTLRERLDKKRGEVRRDHKKHVRAIRINGKKEDKVKPPPELHRYRREVQG